MRQVTSEIVDYMNENEIVVNNTNYKLELLNFIAEGVLNDLNKEQFDDLLHEAMTVSVSYTHLTLPTICSV